MGSSTGVSTCISTLLQKIDDRVEHWADFFEIYDRELIVVKTLAELTTQMFLSKVIIQIYSHFVFMYLFCIHPLVTFTQTGQLKVKLTMVTDKKVPNAYLFERHCELVGWDL